MKYILATLLSLTSSFGFADCSEIVGIPFEDGVEAWSFLDQPSRVKKAIQAKCDIHKALICPFAYPPPGKSLPPMTAIQCAAASDLNEPLKLLLASLSEKDRGAIALDAADIALASYQSKSIAVLATDQKILQRFVEFVSNPENLENNPRYYEVSVNVFKLTGNFNKVACAYKNSRVISNLYFISQKLLKDSDGQDGKLKNFISELETIRTEAGYKQFIQRCLSKQSSGSNSQSLSTK